MFAFNAGIGFDAELVRRVDAKGRRADGKRPGDIAFSWTVVKALVDHRFRYETALEVEGLGRAAFALIANCSPYTYAGSVGLRFVPGASFEGGLDIVAPIEVRPRACRASQRRRCAGGRARTTCSSATTSTGS